MIAYSATFNNNTPVPVKVLVNAEDTYDATSRVKAAYPKATNVQLREVRREVG